MEPNRQEGNSDRPTMEGPTHDLQVSVVSKFSLADFQNAVPVIRELRVANDTDRPLTGVIVCLVCEPAFVRTKTWRIDGLRPRSQHLLKDLDVQANGALLARLTEAEVATLTFTVTLESTPAEQIASCTRTVELLPRNQWGGLSHLPEMAAAFVQPNDPAVDRLLKSAAEVLRKHGRNSALDGYTGGAKRAWELSSAIWSAVSALGLDYALPARQFRTTWTKGSRSLPDLRRRDRDVP